MQIYRDRDWDVEKWGYGLRDRDAIVANKYGIDVRKCHLGETACQRDGRKSPAECTAESVRCYSEARTESEAIKNLVPDEDAHLWTNCQRVCMRDAGRCARPNFEIKCDSSTPEKLDQCNREWIEANHTCAPAFTFCVKRCT